MLKYCYVDVPSRANVKRLFDEYQQTVATVRARHPDVVLVHATMPLTTVESASKAFVKRLLGRKTVREQAQARHEYNELVRSAYAGREPLFDIADVESRRPDGSREFIVAGNDSIHTLVPAYTRDGGHLNGRGQRIAAAALLDVFTVAATQKR
jgi:hypothetical protein